MKGLILAILLSLVFLGPITVSASGDQVVPNGIERIGAPLPTDPVDVDVAILDTGIDIHHPDLNVVGGVNCSGDGLRESDYDDGFGHGTHVAGIIGAKNNSIGVVGVAPGARLWSVRVGYKSGFLDQTGASILCGIEWVKDHADVIDVVNMSLGYPSHWPLTACDHEGALPDPLRLSPDETKHLDSVFHQSVCDLVELGVTVVVAAGNSIGDATPFRPAGFPEVITVSSFADFDGQPGAASVGTECEYENDDTFFILPPAFKGQRMRYGSGYGEVVDITAPGVCILSTYLDATYAYFTGTSMAAPHVTGAAALYKSVMPHATPAEVKGWLLVRAQPQPQGFGDPDEFHEPLLYIGPL